MDYMDLESLDSALDTRIADEVYFILISLILAFGILQTAGAGLGTDKPVVSVVSCSMYPALNVGDIVVVQGESFEDVKEGDILVYSSKAANITVGDEKYSLTNYGTPEKVETAAGTVELINIQDSHVSSDEGGKEAILKIGNSRYLVDEDRTYQINGETVTIDDLEGVSIPVVHRVTEKHDSYLETQGDNNARQLHFEKHVEPAQIHGTSVFVIPRIGGIKLLLMDIVGFNGDKPLVIDSFPTCQEEA